MREPVDFESLAAPGVRGLQPYVPGKPVAALERDYGIRDAIKLASNENPLGPPPAARAAIAETGELARYPDGEGHVLKTRLAEHCGVQPAQITLGNGSNELLVLLAETFLSPGLEAVYDQYAFVVYPLAVQATGATARVAASLPAADPRQPRGHDPAALRAAMGPATRLVFIANPNNPTGTWLGEAALRQLLTAVPDHALVVLDEAYAEYVTAADYPDGLALLAEFPNLVVTRTFSKIYGLAGLRIGYAVSHPAVAELLNRVRQPFNTSSLAQAAALAALADTDFVAEARAQNAAERERLAAGLRTRGFAVAPSQGNFLLVDMGGPAAPWYEGLLRAGVIVRPVANYGLPDCLRITVGLPDQNERLLAALDGLAASGRRP